MIPGNEFRRGLLGGLEMALFMPQAAIRFGDGYDEMIRSFYIPVFLFPISLLVLTLYPESQMSGAPDSMVSMIYSLRFAVSLGVFLGFVYFFVAKIQRSDHFFRFVTAHNWLNVPFAILSLPLIWMLIEGGHDPKEIQAAGILLVIYSLACTAFIAALVFRIPLELAGFIALMGLMINDASHTVVNWVSQAP